MGTELAAFRAAGVAMALMVAGPAWAQLDLEATAATSSAATYLLEDTVEVDVRVTVRTGSYSGPLDIELFASMDDLLDPSDRSLGVTAHSFTPGPSNTATLTARGPPPRTQGRFRVLAQLDPTGSLVDGDRSNDVAATAPVDFPGADVRVFRLVAFDESFLDEPLLFLADARNDGPSRIEEARLQVWLTPMGAAPRSLLDLRFPMEDGETVSFSESINLPPTTPTGLAVLAAELSLPDPDVDPNPANDEAQRSIDVRARVPDLVSFVDTSSLALEAGQELRLSHRVENVGFADAPMSVVAVVLSEDQDITPSDLELFRGPVPALPVGVSDVRLDPVLIPVTTRPGDYWLGLRVDADGEMDEVDEDNNATVGPAVALFAPDLQVVTRDLPVARRGVPYEAGLLAAGGTDPNYRFEVAAGSLPDGIGLTAGGIIEGTPTALGTFEFTVRVVSGGRSANQGLALRVRDPTIPLAVTSTALGTFPAGRTFSTRLVAVGGAPPYTFEPVGALPGATELAPDGTWSGRVTSVGPVTFRVRVQDSLQEQVEGSWGAEFVDPSQGVQLFSGRLPDGRVGEAYCDPDPVRLPTEGELMPFVFTAAFPPPGLQLSADGELCGVPSEVGVFTFTANVRDQAGLLDSGNFTVEVQSDDSVRLTGAGSLPDATADRFYEVALSAEGGRAPYGFSVFTGELPPGLELTPEGRVRGTPTEVGLFLFAAEVRDARGAVGRGPLSLRVVEPTSDPEESCGCRAVPPASGTVQMALVVVLLGGAWVRRSRRGRRGA